MNKADDYTFAGEPMTLKKAVRIVSSRLDLCQTDEERTDVYDDLSALVGFPGPDWREELDERDLPGVLCVLLRCTDAKLILSDPAALTARLRMLWPGDEGRAADFWVHEAWQAAGVWMLQTALLPRLAEPELDNLESALQAVSPSVVHMFQVFRARTLQSAEDPERDS